MKILAKSAARAWAAGLKNSASRSCIISPYVTSSTLDLLVERSAPTGCDLYTLFEAENFMVGASSVCALRRAAANGCRLFHVDELHAKVIIGDTSFATIGSQNVTQRGTRNKEVTAVLTEPDVIQDLVELVGPWLSEATPISTAMIDQMEELVTPLMKEYQALLKRAIAVDDEIETQELTRQEEAARQLLIEADEVRAKELAIAAAKAKAEDEQRILEIQQSLIFQTKIAEAVSESTQNSEVKFCKTLYMQSDHEDYETLSREFGGDLTSWGTDTLTRAHRFLCMAEDSGRLGWARLFASRISHFGKSVERNEQIFLDGARWNTEFSAVWDGGDAVGHNLTVTLKRDGFTGAEQIVLACSMTINSLDVLGGRTTITNALLSRHLQRILTDGVEFASATLPLILSPFRYTSRLRGGGGGDARQFLGSQHDYWRLRRVKRGTRDFLVASPGWS